MLFRSYRIDEGTNGFPSLTRIPLEFFYTNHSNDIKSGKAFSKYPSYAETEPGIHRLEVAPPLLPARFTRIVAVADKNRRVVQGRYDDDRRALTAVFAKGFVRMSASEGIATYRKGTGLSAVYATVVELRRATARVVSNRADQNLKLSPNEWWAYMAKTLPAGRGLKAMTNGTYFGPELWYSPDFHLYYTHGLKTTGVSMLPKYPKAHTWCIGWNAGYASIASFNPDPFMGYAKPWFGASPYTTVLGGIAPTSVVSPASTIPRNWLGVAIMDAPLMISQTQFGYDALISLVSFQQTAAGMWGQGDLFPFVQLDAGASTTLFGAGIGQQSALKFPRVLPHVLGFYSN